MTASALEHAHLVHSTHSPSKLTSGWLSAHLSKPLLDVISRYSACVQQLNNALFLFCGRQMKDSQGRMDHAESFSAHGHFIQILINLDEVPNPLKVFAHAVESREQQHCCDMSPKACSAFMSLRNW